MKLKFFDFTLDSNKQTFFHQEAEIEITKINYQVLLFFIEHRGQVVTKEEIYQAVWQDRVVTDNSVDQSISKIRKSIADFDDRVVIKTVYGKGLEFMPKVKVIDESVLPVTELPQKQRNKRWVWAAFVFMLLLFWQFSGDLIEQPRASQRTPVIWLTNENTSDWLDQSSQQLLSQLFDLNHENYLIDSEKKPKQLSNSEYIQNYWRINPKIEVIKTDLRTTDDRYTLNLEVATQSGVVNGQFTGISLLKILFESNQWLIENSSLIDENSSHQKLLPQDPHVLELHLRSLNAFAKGELDQALSYAQLASEQDPGFTLATLQLAKIYYAQGDNAASLNSLDQVKQSNHYEQLEIAEQSQRGDILDTSGDYQLAIEIYQQLLQKYPEESEGKLLAVKFNLSYPLATEQRYTEALQVLNEIINTLADRFDLDLLAHAWHKKGSILLQMGQTAEAKQAADLAYQHFNNLSDMMSSAKVSILLARIANFQADYQLAADYLQQAIGVYRQAEFRLGLGAALNELIYILMVNGQLTEAWTNMLEMRQIAVDIDYFAMVMAAKEFEIEIARHRDQWAQAEAALADYLRLSTTNEFTRGLFKHQLLELELALDQQQILRAEPLIENIQKHIQVSGEDRFQPSLNIQQARVLLMQNQTSEAIELLNQTKALALLNKDQESVHSVNNQLLKQYLSEQNYEAAKQIIDAIEQTDAQPLAYPYLLYKSKTYLGLGDSVQAQQWAQQSKKQAHEFWRPADEQYLNRLN